MILNSYNLRKSLLMKKRMDQYKNTITIVPKYNMYSLTSTFIEKQNKYVEEIKKVDTTPKKRGKRDKNRIPLSLDLSELDFINLPKLKQEDDQIEEDDQIVIVNKGDDKEEEEGIKIETTEETTEEPLLINGGDDKIKVINIDDKELDGGGDRDDIKRIVVTSFF